MTGDLDPLAAVRASATALDALAAGTAASDDPALGLLFDLRASIDAAVASTSDPEVRRDAALLDALAMGSVSRTTDPAVSLLHALRATVDGATVSTPVAVAAVRLAAGSRRRRRVLRTGVAAGSVALALSMSGVAAAAYGSHPGNSLYGLRTQTFGRTDDDPVAAVEALSTAKQQIAAALHSPTDTSAATKARAAFKQAQHDIAAEHDPAAQKSIAASAATVETTLAVLPVVAPGSRSPRPVESQLAGRRSGGPSARPAKPAASATDVPVPSGSAVVSRSPEATPGVNPEPSVSPSASASPVVSDSPVDSPSPTDSVSPTPSESASGSPSAAPSSTASPTDSPVVVASSSRPAGTLRSGVPVKPAKPKVKVKKKKAITATLMTAQLPSSGLPQR